MRLSRRRFLGGAAAAALGGAGVYELVDKLSPAPHRTVAEPAGMPAEQHVIDLGTVESEGVEVVVPPLHSAVVTATLDVSKLTDAQQELENALRELDTRFALDPAGLVVTVAWGLPYFDRYVPAQAKLHLPYDRRARKPALLPTRTFPSDPQGTLLEENDVAVLFRCDRLDHIEFGRNALFEKLSLFRATSIRRGFAGGGFHGGQSLPQKLAVAAGVPGADLIPEGSELFLGFTSTQKAGLGPRLIANHETLGYVDLGSGYFRHGTHMHLSHITEDLEAWYLNFDFDERVLTAFRPGHDAGAPGDADGRAGPEAGVVAAAARAPVQADGAVRAQRLDPGGLAAPARHGRRGRDGVSEGDGGPAARRLQHARQPVRLDGRPEARRGGATSRQPACTSSCSTRRATTSSATGWRWTACCRTARSSRCRRARARRGSTRSSPRRTARTSSCRRACTARSRSPSCEGAGRR